MSIVVQVLGGNGKLLFPHKSIASFTMTIHCIITRSLKIYPLRWVPLIEKAVAKLFGGFYNLKAGHCGEGLQLLTGTPIDSIKMADFQDDLELFWG